MRRWLRPFTFLALLPVATTALGDELYLKQGDKLVGTLQRVEDDTVTFETDYAGALEVPRDQVVGIVTSEPVTVVFPGNEYVTGRLSDRPGPGMEVTSATLDKSGEFELAGVEAIYREDPREIMRQKLAVKFTGNVNLGYSTTSGNTDSESAHFDGMLRARTPKNRYTVYGEYNQEEADGIETQNDATLSLKYDHFLSEKWYWFNSATFERDDFQDLNLRTALAGGMGYQFFETDEQFLSVEGGLAYINEDFETVPDEDSIGARWAVDYEQQLLGWLRVFHFHEGLQDLDNTDNLIVRSRTGLRFKLNGNLHATTQANLDWDQDPVPGREKLDEKYLVTLGYSF